MKFGDILRELLEDNDISQKQMAADLNIATSTIGNYIRGIREPDFEILKLFAAYFNVSTDYLLDFRSDITGEHDEDELLRLYRVLPDNLKEIFGTRQAIGTHKYKRKFKNLKIRCIAKSKRITFEL